MTKTIKAFSDAKRNIEDLIDNVVVPTPEEECAASDPTGPCIVSKEEAKEYVNEDLKTLENSVMSVFSLLGQTDGDSCCGAISEATFCIVTNYISSLFAAYEFGTPTTLSSPKNDTVILRILELLDENDLDSFYTEITFTDLITFGIRNRVKEATSLLKLIVPQQSCFKNDSYCCIYLADNISKSFSVIANGYVDGANAVNYSTAIPEQAIAKAAIAMLKLVFLQLTPFRTIALSTCGCCKEAAQALTCLISATIQFYVYFINMKFVDASGRIISDLDVTLQDIKSFFNAIFNPIFTDLYPQALNVILNTTKCIACSDKEPCCCVATNAAKLYAYQLSKENIVYNDMINGLGKGRPVNAVLVSLITANIYKPVGRILYAINNSSCNDCCEGITNSVYCLAISAFNDEMDFLQDWNEEIDYDSFLAAEPGDYSWADLFFEEYKDKNFERSLTILKNMLDCECKAPCKDCGDKHSFKSL